MANGNVQIPPDSTGKKIDAASLDVGTDTVIRQRVVIGDDSATAQFATVTAGALLVTGAVGVSGTASVVVGAGTANIGFIDHISAAVALAAGTANIGAVSLAAGTAKVGFIGHISATVNTVIGQGSSNIGGVSLVAGTANIGFINNISAPVALAAGAQNIGYINNISATVNTSAKISGFTDPSGDTRNVVDSSNLALRVNVVAGSSGGVSMNDNTSYTATSAFVPLGGVFNDVGTTQIAEDKAGAVRITTNRAIHAHMRTDGGQNMDDSTNLALRVNVVAGAAGGVSLNDNASFTATSAFVPIGGVFNDDTTTTVTEDRAGAARITTNRAIHVNLRDNAGGEISSGNALSVKVERVSATASVVLAAGTAKVGFVGKISATVNTVIGAGTALIGGVSLVAGTANIGFINNISATVNTVIGAGIYNIGGVSLVAGTANIGAVSLAAGTAKIGFIGKVSATVNTVVGAGTALMGAVSIAAGTANIGFINNISATVNVVITGWRDNSGDVRQLIDSANVSLRVAGYGTLGSLPIGGFIDSSGQNRYVVDSVNLALRVNIAAASGTVTVVTANPWIVNIPSASHGPAMLQRSTSATAVLVAAPGAGFHIYVTSLAVSNLGTVNTMGQIGWSGSPGLVQMAAAANGGGFVMNFDPPWKVQSNESVNVRVKPNTSGNAFFNINFYVST